MALVLGVSFLACSRTPSRQTSAAALADATEKATDSKSFDTDADAEAPLPDVQVDAVPGLDVAPLADVATVSDAVSAADSPDAAAGADAADGADVPDALDFADAALLSDAAPSGAPTWSVAGGCATPAPWLSAGCAGIACAPGTVCMGNGLCLPDASFALQGEGGEPSWPALASHESGAWAVAYSVGTVDTGMQVRLIVAAKGDTITGAPLQVSDATSASHFAPTVTSAQDGTWLVLWRVEDEAAGLVAYEGRRVAADGASALGPVFTLNTTALGVGESSGATNIIAPVVTRLRNGNLLGAWSGGAKGMGIQLGVYARLFDTAGQPLGGEIDTGTVISGQLAFSPVIAPLIGGTSLIAWEVQPGGKSADPFVQGRRFDSAGVAVGAAQALSPQVKVYEGLPGIVGYQDGEVLVTWKAADSKNGTTSVQVNARRLSSALKPVTGAIAHTLDFDAEGTYPSAAPAMVLADGRAVVAWHNQGTGMKSMYLSRYYRADDAFDCVATDIAGPWLPTELGERYIPALTGFADGRILVAWQSLVTNAKAGGTAQNQVFFRFLPY